MAATNYTPIQLYFSTTASAVPLAANLAQGELAINITDGKLYYEDNGGVVQVIATKGAGTIGGTTTQIQYNNAGALAGNAAMTFNSGTSTTTLTTLNLTNALGATYGGTAQSAYTQGDVLYASATNTLAKLGIGTVNYILTSTGTVPQWVAPSSITVNTATNLAGGLGGSVPYQSALDTTTFLAIGAANRVMTSTGTAPQWVTALTGLTGVSSSSITNTSLTSGRVVVSSTAGLQADDADLTFDGTTLSAGGFSTVGLSTLVKTVKIGDSNFSGVAVFAPSTPAKLYMGTGTVTDVTSAISATNTTGAIASLGITPIAATNTGVTYTNASTLYIAGAPSAGTNITITNPYSLYVNAGAAYFGGAVTVAGSLSLAAVTVTSLTDSGNLTFTGTGNRITGDFSNATVASNVIFQTSTVNSGSYVRVMPNGTASVSGFQAYASGTDPGNTSNFQIRIGLDNNQCILYSNRTGTGTYLPMAFNTSGTDKLSIAADATGTYTFGGTAPRITGDFSNATYASRVLFQTSTTNGASSIGVIPNGTGVNASLFLDSDSAATNSSRVAFQMLGGSEARLSSTILGTGTYLPMTFYTGGSEAMRISSTAGSLGSVGIGYSSALTGIGNNGLAVLGYVGIGTTTPTNRLNVVASDSTNIVGASTAGITITNTYTGAYGYSSDLIYGLGGGAGTKLAGISGIYTAGGGELAFYTYNGATFTEKMRINGRGDVGIGVAPSAWADFRALDIGSGAIANYTGTTPGGTSVSSNLYFNGSSYIYKNTGAATLSSAGADGVFYWYNAASGTAGASLTLTERMRIDSSGNVGIGTSSPNANAKLHLYSSVVSNAGILRIQHSSSSYNSGLVLLNGNSTNGGNLFIDGVGGLQLIQGDNNYLVFGTNNTERARIDSSGNVLVTNPAGLGYGTGSGGTVTQATDKSTGVTLNKPTGQITMNNAALLPATSVVFVLSNSLLAATDSVIVQPNYGTNSQAYTAQVTFAGAGGVHIRVTNITAGSLSEAVTLSFAIIKGATS